MSIGRWLESENLPSPDGKSHWSTYSVSRIIRNPTYTGRRCEQIRKGHKRTYGKTIMWCEPLTDAVTFRRANEALTRRPKRGPQNTPDRAMLAGVLWCLRCGSPMYRLKVYNRDFWYRCHGKTKDGTQRKSCGNMVQLEKLDAMVSARMERATAHIFETKVTPGMDHTAEIEEIKMEIGDLGKQDLSDEEFDKRMAGLRAERDRLNSLPVVLDRIEQIDTGVSYAEMWSTLSDSERGQWLRKAGIKIYALKRTQEQVDDIAAKGGMFGPEDAPPEVIDGVALYIPSTMYFPLAKTRGTLPTAGYQRARRCLSGL